MPHLITLVMATPEDHTIFVENMKRAALPLEPRKDWCDCHETTHFQVREIKLYEIYFTDRANKAAYFYLEDWFKGKSNFYNVLKPFYKLLRLIPFCYKLKPFSNPSMRWREWIGKNFRTEILGIYDKEVTIPCGKCKKKIYFCDW